MRLLILKTGYDPSFEEHCKLEELQDWFRSTNQSIFIDVKFDKYQYLIRRGQLANRLRSKWKILEGGCSTSPVEEKRISEG
jgi:hypothetical protein